MFLYTMYFYHCELYPAKQQIVHSQAFSTGDSWSDDPRVLASGSEGAGDRVTKDHGTHRFSHTMKHSPF